MCIRDRYDSNLVVGILGGSAGTTYDAFKLIHDAQKYGARVALFGRKIQRAESQLALVALMRPVIRGDLTPTEAVRRYHEVIEAAGLTAVRTLVEDREITDPVLSRAS